MQTHPADPAPDPDRVRSGRGDRRSDVAVNSPEPALPLPPRLDQLLVIRRWLQLTLERVDARIATVRARGGPGHAAAAAGARRLVDRVRPRPPAGPDPRPRQHLPPGQRSRPADRQTAVETLRAVPDAIACPLCRPDRELGLLDQ
ncbi:DUF6233 domain-containing protein [Streptomyces goshikiensis]